MSQLQDSYDSGTNGTDPRYETACPSYDESSTPDSERSIADRKRKFIVAFQWGAGVTDAARFAGIPKTTVYRWRKKDPEFALAWSEGRNNLVNDLEIMAFKLAKEGNVNLLKFLLKSYRPATFNQRPAEPKPATSKVGTFIELVDKVREWV